MFKSTLSLGYIYRDASLFSKLFPTVSTSYIQNRNAYVLKRKYPINLQKKGQDYFRLKGKDYVYELVENTDFAKKPDVQLILKTYVEGLGHSGDIVTVKRRVAYNQLLVTGLAEYATPEALERAKLLNGPKQTEIKSANAIVAKQTVGYLERQVLSVVMNKETPWTIKPWHIRVSFRKAGIHAPEGCIILPEQPISGPDPNLEDKEFCVTVVIDNTERGNVRCRIHHWSTNLVDRLPVIENYWTQPKDPIFSADVEKLSKLKLPTIMDKSKSSSVCR